MTSTPTVGFGFVYVTSWNGKVYALREETGELVWTFDLAPAFPIGTQSSATLTADGRLVVGDADATVHCLDARSGEQLWVRALSIPFEGEAPSDHNWGSPTVANNRVFVGIASHADSPCTRGRLVGLDLDTGDVLWDLATVPVRVCDNDTSQTCTGDTDCNGGTCIRGRGAGVTATAAVDATGETVYMNTVGCYTYPSIGDSDSMFRVDAATGNVVWKHRVQLPEQFSACADSGVDCRSAADCGGSECTKKQFYHDFGFLNGPMVIQADDGMGGTRPLVVSGSKDGTLYAFNPNDGSFAWTNEVVPTPMTPGFAGYGLFNGAIGFANQRIHAALYFVIGPGGNRREPSPCLQPVDGHELWHDEIGNSWSHVGIANDLLFAGTEQTMQRCSSNLQQECARGPGVRGRSLRRGLAVLCLRRPRRAPLDHADAAGQRRRRSQHRRRNRVHPIWNVRHRGRRYRVCPARVPGRLQSRWQRQRQRAGDRGEHRPRGGADQSLLRDGP